MRDLRFIGRYLVAAIVIFCRPLRRWWVELRYQTFVRVNRLPLYRLSASERTGQQIAFASLYQQQQQTFSWIPKPHYFIGGSADPAFLSILIRVLTENEIHSVIEFGAGQTTRALSSWSDEMSAEVFTIDHDQEWVERLRSSITSSKHHVIHAPLRTGPLGLWYDLAAFKERFPDVRADLIIVDGPLGTRRNSRAGIVHEFANLSRSECVVLWDDLNRLGDLESFSLLVDRLRARDTTFDLRFCQAFRTLGILFTPQYADLHYYC